VEKRGINAQVTGSGVVARLVFAKLKTHSVM
jgi:hypothetical protein